MDGGSMFLVHLCRLEARATWLWLNLDREPGHQFAYGNSRGFIRGIMGAQILDGWVRDGLITREDIANARRA